LGSLIQPGQEARISFHHNLYAHQTGRLPRVGTEKPDDWDTRHPRAPFVGSFNDFRNNVFYNWFRTAGTGARGQPSSNNFIGNFYLVGPGGEDPAGGPDPTITTKPGGTSIFDGANGPTGVYHSGNRKDINRDGDADDSVALTDDDFPNCRIQGSAYAEVPYAGLTDAAPEAYRRVLNYVGARWNDRNAIDARLIEEVRRGAGRIKAWNDPAHGTQWNGLLARRPKDGVAPSRRPANFDTDRDGLPDTWEIAHGLDPAAPDNNGDGDADGYTNLEEYLNELAAWPAARPIVWFGGDGRYELSNHWDIRWQPSRLDDVGINSGTATVTSVGQHAGVLTVAAGAGDVATLAVSGGWIAIARDLIVGPARSERVNQTGGVVRAGRSVFLGGPSGAAGVYALSGGSLRTPLLTRGAAGGTFDFLGGTLHAGRVTIDLRNRGGTLAPSDGIGSTYVGGNLTLEGGSVAIELASGTLCDTIAVDGELTLGGALEVKPFGDYRAPADARWLIMTARRITGRFQRVTDGYRVEASGGDLFLVPDTAEPKNQGTRTTEAKRRTTLAEMRFLRRARPWYCLERSRIWVMLSARAIISPILPNRRSNGTWTSRGGGDGMSRSEAPDYLDVLVLCSAPFVVGDLLPLSLGQETEKLAEVARTSSIPIRLLSVFPPTFEQLKDELSPDRLRSQRPRVFHFLGHGDEDGLWFEKEDGSEELVPAEQLCKLFRGSPIDLAVLNACWSDGPRVKSLCELLTSTKEDQTAGVLTAIGHGRAVSDQSAIEFARQLYREILAERKPVGSAKEAAAKALREQKLPGWDQIRLHGDPNLRLGHDLARRERAGLFVDRMPKRQLLPDRDPFFCGRAEEYLTISRSLAEDDQSVFAVWGMGGIGKTALVVELAWRNAWRYIDGGVAVVDARKVETPTLHALLQTALVHLAPGADLRDPALGLIGHMKSAPAMIVLDNLETLPDSEHGPVADFLNQIPKGSRVILTSRVPIPHVKGLPRSRSLALTRGLGKISGTYYVRHQAEVNDVKVLLSPKEDDWEGILAKPCEWLNERLSGHPQMIRIAVPIAREGLTTLKAHLDALSGDLQTQLDAMVKTGMDRAGKEGRRLVAYLTFFPAGCFTREELEEVCAPPSGEGVIDAASATSDRADDLSWLDTGLQRLTEGGLLDFSEKESIYTFHETLLDYARRVAPLDQERVSGTWDRLLRCYLKYVRRNHGNNRAIDRCIDNAHVLMGKIWSESFDWESPRYRRRITRLISLVRMLWEYHLERGRWRRAAIWHERFLDQLFPIAPEWTVKAARRGEELLRYALLLSRQGKPALASKRFDACIELEERRGISVVFAYALMGKAALMRKTKLEQNVEHLLKATEQLEQRALEILRLLGKERYEP
jgi:hypothetical protein